MAMSGEFPALVVARIGPAALGRPPEEVGYGCLTDANRVGNPHVAQPAPLAQRVDGGRAHAQSLSNFSDRQPPLDRSRNRRALSTTLALAPWWLLGQPLQHRCSKRRARLPTAPTSTSTASSCAAWAPNNHSATQPTSQTFFRSSPELQQHREE